MHSYPINLDLKNKKVLIIGAGKVAFRKFKRLIKTGAEIKIISPQFNRNFFSYLKNNSEEYKFIKRKYKKSDINDVFLVFAATDDKKANEDIARLAKKNDILINAADNAELSDFTLPAAVRQGKLLLTAASGSYLPALSKKIKEKLKKEFGIEYRLLLDVMAEKRNEIISEIDELSKRREIFKKLASDQFLQKIKDIVVKSDQNINEYNNGEIRESELKYFYIKIEAEIDKIIEQTEE